MTGYHIYQSNSLSSLVEKNPDRLVPGSLFDDSLCMVVQNRNMGEWLKLKLAEIRGVSADFRFTMPEKALRDLCGGYPSARHLIGGTGEERPVLFLDNLKVILFRILEELLTGPEQQDPVFRELALYVRGGDPSDPSEIPRVRSARLYELADHIAGLFYHYGMNCRELIGAWESGRLLPEMPRDLRKHEDWQSRLWNLLFHPDRPYLHLSRLLSEIMEKNDSYDGTVSRVVLFGSSFLGDTALNFFYHLSRDIRVDHFILSPSRIYSAGDFHVENPLLNSWSTLIGGFASLSAGFEGAERRNEYSGPSADTLLGMLQNDILENRGDPPVRTVGREDHSLRIHTFTSRWREVEVLKDLILNALNDDPDLKLTDIGVLAPDINDYSPFLEALFPSSGERDHLPWNVIDLTDTSESPLVQGFLHLLSLPGERFSRKDLFILFDNPCFRQRFGISRHDRDFWLDLCMDLNIKWGMDGPHKQDFYPEATGFNSWEEGFSRLLEGLFLEEEDDRDSLPVGLSDETGFQTAGRMMACVRSLFHDLYELNRAVLPLDQWVLMAESFLETYLDTREDHRQDQKDRWRLKAVFRDLLNIAEESVLPGGNGGVFDFTVFRILLSEFIRKSTGERGRYLTQGVTCSSLKPLRAIPFRRIYVLGLNETAFPGDDTLLSFDLRETVQQTIDLSRRGSDKYAFLETLLSAGDSLTLFFNDRDPVRGEALQPSILISELMEYLNARFAFEGGASAEETLIRRESIHDYDPRYFSGAAGFRSFSRRALISAETALQPGGDEPAGADLSLPVREETDILSLRDLMQFLNNPAAYYYNRALGIYLKEEDNPEEDSEENWESGFFDRYRYLKQRLGDPSRLADPEQLELFLKEEQIRGSLPDSDLIFLERDFLSGRLEGMAEQLAEKGLAGGLPEPRDYLIAPEHAPSRREEGVSDRPAVTVPELVRTLNDGRMLKLTGLLEELSPLEESGVWGTMEFCESGKPVARHFLPGLVKSLMLNALTEEGALEQVRELRLFQIGKRPYEMKRFDLAPSPGRVEKGTVPLSGPGERLDRLLRLCLKQKEQPVLLYPELGEALAAEMIRRPEMGDLELLEYWRQIWRREAEKMDSRGAGPFLRCPYRTRFLQQVPETEPALLREMAETVYLPFILREV